MSDRDITEQLKTALAARHNDGGWAYFTEVSAVDGEGYTAKLRYADAVAFGLWGSRGHDLHGFEIKASRADWLRELNNGAKAEPVAKYCAHWWVVTVPGVVAGDELPGGWGLMELSAKTGKLRVKKQAPRQERVEPITLSLIATLLSRGLRDVVTEHQAKARERVANQAGYERGKRSAEHRPAAEKLERLQREVDEFERVSGIKIDGFYGRGRALGAAVKTVDEYGVHLTGYLSRVRSAVGAFEREAAMARDAYTRLKGAVEGGDVDAEGAA
jgi:hypothetical protein